MCRFDIVEAAGLNWYQREGGVNGDLSVGCDGENIYEDCELKI